MTRLVAALACALLGGAVPLFGQAGDVNRILADTRAALGGDARLAGVKTFTASGHVTRVVDGASMDPAEIEIAFELPARFVKKEGLALPMLPAGAGITRTSGFNGESPIEIVDRPPSMPGNIVIRMGPGDPAPGTPRTPEQEQDDRRRQVIAAKQELARFTLGILASSLAAYPLQFSFAGQAESPDGRADVLDVRGEGGFAARLFVDASTHLPLMLSWTGKEPLIIRRSGPPAGAPGRREGPAMLTDEERRQAEASRRSVEFRLYYGDYRETSGVKVPFTLRRSIDGKPAEEVTFEKVTIN